MSYTNIELVRQNFDPQYPISDKIYDQPLVIVNDNFIRFFSGSIDSNSVVVKSLRNYLPIKSDINLSTSTKIISNDPIVPNTIVVASDSSLGTIYKENADYIIDYANGTLSLKDDGALSVGSDISVSYITYFIYELGQDYQIKASDGSIKRFTSGNIALNETVYLDYQPNYNYFSDDLFEHAVKSANSIIEQAVDPNQQFGANLILQSAATYRAMEIIAHSAASRELSGKQQDEKKSLAWLNLAVEYSRQSEKLLSQFKEPLENISIPTKG
jgi:hypothetical protein